MNKHFIGALLASTCLVTLSGAGFQASAAAVPAAAVPVVADGIGGVVTGAKGPEAGVWVIAETRDLPTRFIKIVVTDDQGRFMLPQLPKANYQVWVRGYGLVDSKAVEGTLGKNLNLASVQAPDAKAAAQIYPSNYWEAMIHVPPESDFPGTGPKGNGISPTMITQQNWLTQLKNGCHQCHQIGDRTTRTLLDNSPEGWAERITKARGPGDQAFGDHGPDFSSDMQNRMTQFGRTRSLGMFADWTQRIAKGELPPEAPPRPAGVERNIVLTSWDWSNGRYDHDNVSTDRHDPTVNANGPVYGVIGYWGFVESLNPATNEMSEFGYKVTPNVKVEILPPDVLPDAFPHNPMIDRNGELWLTDLGHAGAPRPNAAPPVPKAAYCTDPANKFAKYYPQPGNATTTIVHYDPKAKKIEGIPMCNGLHHLMFASDRKTLFFSGGGSVNGSSVASWADIDVWAQTHDAQKTVGWCPMVLDTNSTNPSKVAGISEVSITPDRMQWNEPARTGGGGNDPEGTGGGARPPAVAPAPFDPKKDTRVNGSLYGIDADISDGSMWAVKTSPFPTGIVRFHPGTNPPETCKTEFYEPTKLPDGKTYEAFNARGMSVDSKGVAWVGYANGRLGKLERSKCKVMSGPKVADGQQCPEGWTYYDTPGPKMAGVKTGSADFHYLMWVDLHDTLGLGKDVPIVTGSNSDSLLAFDTKTEKFNVLRVPYPMDFHTRGMDGRIDDVKAGWKGKGVFATYASQPVWHQEGGEDAATGPQLVKFQVRPDPLAY
ncbi:MAG: carboxypeptidase regulatory-like domain-containing protein [Rhodospirillaceae bacterium]|nr:carboxypeptidase regulatory-like domain-containing protein [Rhodospirillaceae bacterium]